MTDLQVSRTGYAKAPQSFPLWPSLPHRRADSSRIAGWRDTVASLAKRVVPPHVRTHPSDLDAGRRCDPNGGAAAVEFAILAPVLVMLLFGIVMYGGYFLMSHSIQQLANDAARAAVGGMSDAERQQLASTSLAGELPTYGYLAPAATQLTYADQGGVMTVSVAYDASGSPLWALHGVIPMPSSAIVRSASVQVGGF